MNHYFLTDGKPDPSKTPEPLVLHGFHDQRSLHVLAGDVPGLETCSGGDGMNRSLYIGWSWFQVYDTAMNLNRPAREAHKEAKNAKWRAAMEKHREFVAKVNNGKGRKPKAKPFELAMCAGSYVVLCEKIANGYTEGSTQLFTLDIAQPRGHQDVISAAFDFVMFEGTMLLSLSQEKLDAIVGEKSHGIEDDFTYDSYDDDEDSDSDDPRARRKRKASPFQPTGRQSKKAKTVKTNEKRVEFVFHGRETGEGQIYADPESGYIDFLGDDCHAFERMMDDFPCVGKNLEIRGYKISALPKRKPERWASFSWGAYEAARVGQWR